MGISLILQGKATLEDLYVLNRLGYEFVVTDGQVTQIIEHRR